MAEIPQSQESLVYISGLVTDEKGEPIIGASVLELGTTRGTHTDLDGRFALRTTPNAILRISYIGYASQEVKAVNDITVKLKENTTSLDEIVVVGYGQQKKVNLTGAVTTVDVARNLESRPQQDVSKALQGTVPGLSVVNSQGGINNEPTLSIRGVGTLSNNAQSTPYILVDGVPMEEWQSTRSEPLYHNLPVSLDDISELNSWCHEASPGLSIKTRRKQDW
jgi:hypothetical protein